MGVFIDYELSAECAEEEIASRLERVRQRCLDLPFESVGEVRRIAPVYNPVNVTIFQSEGHTLPPEVQRRFDIAESDDELAQLSIAFGLLPPTNLPEHLQMRYLAPAIEFIDTTDIWKREELPEQLSISAFGFTSYSFNRATLELEFTNILLRYGYVLVLDPGEGSEEVTLGLATYAPMEGSRISGPPFWFGKSFTRTQYAENFILVHETVCRALDIVKEEGLLFKASDTCGYYADRTWKKAGKQVNDEMIFAKAVSNMMDLGIGNLREEGIGVEVLIDNASKAKPVDFSSRLKPEAEEDEYDEDEFEEDEDEEDEDTE